MNLYGLKQLIDSIRTVRKNTIQIAEDIPKEQYGYRPTPESRSVAETLVHIFMLPQVDRRLHGDKRVSSLEGFNFAERIEQSEAEEKRPRTKSDIGALLRTGGERHCEWLGTFPEALLADEMLVLVPGGTSKTCFEMLLGSKEHELHHRAQLMVIERLLGIVPHLTRQRRESSLDRELPHRRHPQACSG